MLQSRARLQQSPDYRSVPQRSVEFDTPRPPQQSQPALDPSEALELSGRPLACLRGTARLLHRGALGVADEPQGHPLQCQRLIEQP